MGNFVPTVSQRARQFVVGQNNKAGALIVHQASYAADVSTVQGERASAFGTTGSTSLPLYGCLYRAGGSSLAA
jgi:hypothetical protein